MTESWKKTSLNRFSHLGRRLVLGHLDLSRLEPRGLQGGDVDLVRHLHVHVELVGRPVRADVELLELDEQEVGEGLEAHLLLRERPRVDGRRVEVVDLSKRNEICLRMKRKLQMHFELPSLPEGKLGGRSRN